MAASIQKTRKRIYDRDSGSVDWNAKFCWNQAATRREREPMDVLSDVLRVVRLTSAVFFSARFSSPWSIESPPQDRLAPLFGLRSQGIPLLPALCKPEHPSQMPTPAKISAVKPP